jgi:DnaD/phage-associated family protein
LPPDGKGFHGFPNSGAATVVPSLFFAQVMPDITDPCELAVCVYAFFATSPGRVRGRRPPFVTRRELESDQGLMRCLQNLAAGSGGDALASGLGAAVRRGILLRGRAEDGDELFAVNTPANYASLARLPSSHIEAPLPPATGAPSPNIFALYEQNIGGITPLIAADLQDAEQRYPAEWIEAAFREAVELNKRNWRYIQRILERWETEGPSYEEAERDPEREWLARRYRERKPRPGAG